MSLDGRSPVLPLPSQANMLSALASAFEAVAGMRDFLPEQTYLWVTPLGMVKLNIAESAGSLEERRAVVAKVAERLGLPDPADSGTGFGSRSGEWSVRTPTVGAAEVYKAMAAAGSEVGQ